MKRSRPTPPLDLDPLADVLPLGQAVELDEVEVAVLRRRLALMGAASSPASENRDAIREQAKLAVKANALHEVARSRTKYGDYVGAASSGMKALETENSRVSQAINAGIESQSNLWEFLLLLADVHEPYGDIPRAVRLLDAAFDSAKANGFEAGAGGPGLSEVAYNERRTRMMETHESNGRSVPNNELSTNLLPLAAGWCTAEFLSKLIAAGADVNTPDDNEITALHTAAESGLKTTCELLLSSGASVDAKSKDGQTPLDLAATSNHVHIEALLNEHISAASA